MDTLGPLPPRPLLKRHSTLNSISSQISAFSIGSSNSMLSRRSSKLTENIINSWNFNNNGSVDKVQSSQNLPKASRRKSRASRNSIFTKQNEDGFVTLRRGSQIPYRNHMINMRKVSNKRNSLFTRRTHVMGSIADILEGDESLSRLGINSRQRQLQQKPEVLEKFRRIVKLVQSVVRAVRYATNIAKSKRVEITGDDVIEADSFHEALLLSNAPVKSSRLVFDPSMYKANKEQQLSTEAKRVLTTPCQKRSATDLHKALISLRNAVESFCEFPLQMQQSLVRVGWYEKFDSNRVVMRQGHKAERYYFILNGSAVVTVITTENKSKKVKVIPKSFLKKGNSFGENELMHRGTRESTVVSKESMEVLAIEREDFVNIFLTGANDLKSDLMRILRTVEWFSMFPLDDLPYDDPKICLQIFFRRGAIMCKDMDPKWVYVVKSGTCKVIKQLLNADTKSSKAAAPYSYYNPTDRKFDTRSTVSLPPIGTSSAARKALRGILKTVSGSSSNSGETPSVMEGTSNNSSSVSFLLTPTPSNEDVNDIEGTTPLRSRMDWWNDPKVLSMVSPQHTKRRLKSASSSNDEDAKSYIYMQLKKLTTGDSYGILPIIFPHYTDAFRDVTLVSEGAECIMISRKYFVQNLTENHRKYLEKNMRPFPTEETIYQRYKDHAHWQTFKCDTMNKAIIDNCKRDFTHLSL